VRDAGQILQPPPSPKRMFLERPAILRELESADRKAGYYQRPAEGGGKEMRLAHTGLAAMLGAGLLTCAACQTSWQNPKPKAVPPSQVAAQAPADGQAGCPGRFVLYKVQNGMVMSTALLDAQSGRVWLLEKEKSGTEHFVAIGTRPDALTETKGGAGEAVDERGWMLPYNPDAAPPTLRQK
jgi:hypothetical protein